ncbi:propeptide PepSY amd peptidase M4 [Leptotrichia trevisanii]|jgi:hypothetical protein cdivTM_14334|uniref:PepSY domain-containing protein n=1 Tax=Leptotrichia trevisanii TaxID=109328 RepID=UPI0011882BB4|nr:PepSY domain-containing protein [Leptotrichia trevisanii]BBM57575.1 propeptide PepSY amd peptidase M4 [Leptotrichia trevisanii]
MINKIKKRGFNNTITLIIFLLSINLMAKEISGTARDTRLAPMVSIKTSDAQITPNKAKEIALAHAGVAESAANFKQIKLDNKNGKAVYVIEFIANKLRYEFDIDASSGSIIKFEKR